MADECDDTTPVDEVNLVITYGCQPSGGVPALSTIAVTYFAHLKKMAAKTADCVVLPDTLISFLGTDGKAESLIKFEGRYALQHH